MLFGLVVKAQETGTLSDTRDGKSYKTVKIGTQWWMSENLAFKTNGSFAYKNDEKNVQNYGRLYTYETAKNACPTGWHLPLDDDWLILEKTLGLKIKNEEEIGERGVKTKIGIKLKSTNEWKTKGTNESGFNALPAGWANMSNSTKTYSFSYLGSVTIFWSNTAGKIVKDYTDEGIYTRVLSVGTGISRNLGHKQGAENLLRKVCKRLKI